MTCIPAYAQPHFLEYVSARAAKGDEDAQRLMARVKRHSRIPKPTPPGRTREERRAERQAWVSDIRAEVLKRAGENCEACGASMRVAGFELHHVLSGPDRRAEERPDTCMALCLGCHRAWHRNDPQVLRNAKAWALRWFHADALAAIEKRLAKVEAP